MNGLMKRILFLILVFVPAVAGADKVWNSGKGTTWDCKKDATVVVNASKGTWTFKGACKSITLNGSTHKVKIESAESLAVNGAKNTVTIGTVGTLAVTGAKNKVTWTKSASGDAPAISNTGADNQIAQAGAPATSAPVATNAAAPTPTAGSTIDCAKNPSFVTSDNDGSYTLTGKCKQILISGNNNKLKVENASMVALTGNENVIDGGTLATVDTSGNNNKVTYRGAKPKLTNSGNGNKISAVK
jgi:hypothetical protein